MKVKLTFHGPLTLADTTGEAPIPIRRPVAFTTELLQTATLIDAARFFEMERTFNELTKGRLHVELVDE